MVFHHCMFTLGYLFRHEFARSMFDFFTNINLVFSVAFMMLCGISCQLSHSNLKRGFKILAAAAAITAVSLIIIPDAPILFGILHLLGACVMLYIPLRRLIDKIPGVVGIIICAVLFVFLYNIENGYIGFGILSIKLPSSLCQSGYLMVFGLRSPYSAYSDYYPLIPWAFAFFAGTFVGKYFRDGKAPETLYRSRIPFFSTLGTNAFIVYLIHQPIAFGLYYLLSLLGGKPL